MPKRLSDEEAISIVAVAMGISFLCFLDVLGLLTSRRHDVVFHLAGPVSALFVPALANTFLLCVFFYVVLRAVRHVDWFRRIVWSGMIGFLPWVALKNVLFLSGKGLPHWASLSVFACCTVTALLGAFVVSSSLFERMRRAGQFVLMVFAVNCVISVVATVWCGIQARHLNDGIVHAEPLTVSGEHKAGRVIWIVLDEMAHRQVFERRPSDLVLPAFDRLKGEATIFSQVVPAAAYTEIALPSLMSGRPATEVRSSADGRRLWLRGADGEWTEFGEGDTVFADALAMGYRTGAVGWYVPYCRMLTDELSSCFWTGQTLLSGMFPGRGIVQNTLHPVVRLANKIPAFLIPPPGPSKDEKYEGGLHIRDYVLLKQASDDALRDRGQEFLLLHMPIPHPDGIYDRRTGQLGVGGSYVDNIALADAYLGHVREVLEAQGEWDDATVVVMGDHSWRTQLLWRGQKAWKPEDEVTSGGGAFDERPLYVVKLPHQHAGAAVSTRFEATRTRSLFDALLGGRIPHPADLAAWAAVSPAVSR